MSLSSGPSCRYHPAEKYVGYGHAKGYEVVGRYLGMMAAMTQVPTTLGEGKSHKVQINYVFLHYAILHNHLNCQEMKSLSNPFVIGKYVDRRLTARL